MSAELFEAGSRFKVGGLRLDADPFDYDDLGAWNAWTARIDEMVRYNDPWALLGQSPDHDVVVVDVTKNWEVRLQELNVRSVRLIYPAERQTIDEQP